MIGQISPHKTGEKKSSRVRRGDDADPITSVHLKINEKEIDQSIMSYEP